MAFTHSHTITIRHEDGNVERIAVDSGGQELSQLAPGSKVPLRTREETLMELSADWVFTGGQGLTYFGSPEGPYRKASYSVERFTEEAAPAISVSGLSAPATGDQR